MLYLPLPGRTVPSDPCIMPAAPGRSCAGVTVAHVFPGLGVDGTVRVPGSGIRLASGGVEMLVPCQVSKGLRDKEVMVEITDFHGRAESMPLDRDFLVYRGDRPFLP